MAEGFAKAYGADVLEPCSAGLGPAGGVPELTVQVMQEKNIDVSEAFPKGLDGVDRASIDLIVNLTGSPLPAKMITPVENWNVRDPIGESDKVYRQVRDDIERRIQKLILATRAEMNGEEYSEPADDAEDGEERGGMASRFDRWRARFRQ